MSLPSVLAEAAFWILVGIFSLAALLFLLAVWLKPEGDSLLRRCRCKKTRKAVDIRDIDGDS